MLLKYLVYCSIIGINVLILFLFYNTSTNILVEIKEYYRKKGYKNDIDKRLSFIVMLSIIVPMILFIIFENFTKSYLFSILSIHLLITGICFLTDTTVKRINRHISRVAYLSNFCLLLSFGYLTQIENFKYIILSQIIIALVLIFSFFVFSNIGEGDFRCFLLSFPTLVYLFENWGILAIIIELLIINMYLFIKQKSSQLNNGKESFPIGQVIMSIDLIFLSSAILFAII